MLCKIRHSAALIAAVSMMASPLAAQTAAPAADAPAASTPVLSAPGTPATTPATLPSSLTDLGITDATVSPGKRGMQRVQGTLPDGGPFRGMLDGQGNLRMLRMGEDAAVPAQVLDRLVPQAVRSAPIYAEFAKVGGLAVGERGVMLSGEGADGQDIRAAFSADGTLQKFGRGDSERFHGKRGKHDDGRRGHWKGGDDRAERGERGDRRGMPHRPAPMDDAALHRAVEEAGYAQPGAITRNGPQALVEAVNPQGENVTLTLNPHGTVVREQAR